MYINFYITNNNSVNNALVYAAAILFFVLICPIHVINYVYISSENAYASINVTLYRLITLVNINTEKKLPESPPEDKPKVKANRAVLMKNWMKFYNKLCITKIVQLGDFGIAEGSNVYAALTQNALSDALFALVRINGGKTKLKNYTVLNYEHSHINYYLKFVGVINLFGLTSLLLIYLWGKIHELQIKKTGKRKPV